MARPLPKMLRPYDEPALERAALDYAARYATTRAKLRAYLRRKLRERGWSGQDSPPVEALVERFAERGYVDDRAFAAARTDALLRRGYGGRRIGAALRAAGIDAETLGALDERISAEAERAAMLYAQRKRIGPFAASRPDAGQRRRWFGVMVRAGHPAGLVSRLLDIPPGEVDIDYRSFPDDGDHPESE